MTDRDRLRVETSEDVDAVWLVRRLLARWRVFSVAVLLACAVAVLVFFVSPRVYESTVSLIPQAQRKSSLEMLSQVAGLEALGGRGGSSLELYYENIVYSDRLLGELIDQRWDVTRPEGTKGAPLYELLDVPAPNAEADSAVARANLRTVLRDEVVRFSRNSTTGFIEITCRVPESPLLATRLAETIVELLDAFNRSTHRNRSRDLREFLEGRLAQARSELIEAEQALTEFVENNREYASSPILVEQHRRLVREVEAQAMIWQELRRQFEMARIEELRDMPSIQILDHARVPVAHASPRLVVNLVIAIAVGLVLGLVAVLVLEWGDGARDRTRASHDVPS